MIRAAATMMCCCVLTGCLCPRQYAVLEIVNETDTPLHVEIDSWRQCVFDIAPGASSTYRADSGGGLDKASVVVRSSPDGDLVLDSPYEAPVTGFFGQRPTRLVLVRAAGGGVALETPDGRIEAAGRAEEPVE